MMGSRLIKSWSRTQDSVTLSSAEAELVTLSKLAMEMLGVRSMASEWHMMDGCAASKLFVDASAALSIAKRLGAGKMRHVNVKTLWLQEKAVQLELDYVKVKRRRKSSRRSHVTCETRTRREVPEDYRIAARQRPGRNKHAP